MTRKITIHKPTHCLYGESGLIALVQTRGSFAYLNRIENGKVVDKTWAVETAVMDLTGYGTGVSRDGVSPAKERAFENMRSAYLYVFGPDVELPVLCKKAEFFTSADILTAQAASVTAVAQSALADILAEPNPIFELFANPET